MTKKPRFQVKNLNLDCTLVLCLLELLVKVTSILTSTPSDSLTHPMTTVTSRSWCSNSRFHTGRGFLERSRSLNHPPVSFLGTSHSRTEAPLFAQDLDCRRRSFLTEPESISSGAQPKRGVIKKPHGERTVWDQPIEEDLFISGAGNVNACITRLAPTTTTPLLPHPLKKRKNTTDLWHS